MDKKSKSGEIVQAFDFIKVDNVWRFQHRKSMRQKVSAKKSESGQFSTHEIEQVSDYATSEHKHQRPCSLYATVRLKCLDALHGEWTKWQ